MLGMMSSLYPIFTMGLCWTGSVACAVAAFSLWVVEQWRGRPG
jgi:hypothetical protein